MPLRFLNFLKTHRLFYTQSEELILANKKTRKGPTQKAQIPWYIRPFASYIQRVELPNGEWKITYSISNVTINHYLIPIYFLIALAMLVNVYGMPLKSPPEERGALVWAFYSCFFYYWTSMFFQPDLDIPVNRPGMYTFPIKIKKSLRRLPFFNILHLLTAPIRAIWYIIWEPMAVMFTHRGALHWPIVGVWLRVGWILLILKSITAWMIITDITPGYIMAVMEYWCRSFYPWNAEFGGRIFILFAFPVYISDIFHSLFDLLESRKKGAAFCSPIHRRGLLITIAKAIKNIPSEIKGGVSRFRDR